MNIGIHLGDQLIPEAIYQFIITQGYDHVFVSGELLANGVTADVLLVVCRHSAITSSASIPKLRLSS